MRFAWLRENATDSDPVQQGCAHPLSLIRTGYNLAFWVFLLPFFTAMAYSTGFVLMAGIVLIRLALNFYTNNFLEPRPERYESFPFRIP